MADAFVGGSGGVVFFCVFFYGVKGIEQNSIEQDCNTLPETNIVPENRASQKEMSIPTIHFQVRVVSFREGM